MFCGTKSVSRAFEAIGAETLTLDNVSTFQPDIRCDILDWDYTQYGPFDIILASPPCTQYSIARSKAKTPRDLDYADSLVERTLEIIRYLQPLAWFIENPASGLRAGDQRARPLAHHLDWGHRGTHAAGGADTESC